MRQRHDRILGRAPGWQRHRGAESQAGDQGPGQARWQMGYATSQGARARRRHPTAPRRYRASRCAPAGRRRNFGRSVRADGRVFARFEAARRGRVLRLDHPARRNRRVGLCHGWQHLLRQNRPTRRDRAYRQSLSEGRAQNRQLPDRSRGRAGRRHHRRWHLSRRGHPHHAAVRPGADGRCDSGGDAHGAVRHHGGRRAPAGQEAGDRQQAGRHRGTGGR